MTVDPNVLALAQRNLDEAVAAYDGDERQRVPLARLGAASFGAGVTDRTGSKAAGRCAERDLLEALGVPPRSWHVGLRLWIAGPIRRAYRFLTRSEST